MKCYLKNIGGIFAVAFLALGCNGLTVEGTSTLSGTVADTSGAALQTQGHSTCRADTVIATDTSGDTTSTDVETDCSFSLTLAAGESYVISFSSEGNFVATLLFDSDTSGFFSSALPITEKSIDIDLGIVTISGTTATPEREPLEQIDRDGDGVSDRLDEDDDGDGIRDEDEEDCDLDGIHDDLDALMVCTPSFDGMVRVKEVSPRNDPHPELGEDLVDVSARIKMRVHCRIDPETLTSETFRVVSENDTEVACDFEVAEYGSNDRIICSHESNLEAEARYTATVSGIRCLDGREIEARSWTWVTGSVDAEHTGENQDDHSGDN